ncbi:right-handed parallel beta-helix repeat-containing protein [Thermodesulfobacteriota bacterium]
MANLLKYKNNFLLIWTLLLVLTIFPKVPANAKTIYVKAEAGLSGDGKSWSTAMPSLQRALENASSGDEIWVSDGTYYPSEKSDRKISFALKKAVDLYGGFSGTEINLEDRDWKRNRSILSGDIGERGKENDNSYHVVTGADEAILDGFTIEGGYSLNARPGNSGAVKKGKGRIHTTPRGIMQNMPDTAGAGMLNYKAAPFVRNCTFIGNRAKKGGAVYNMTSTDFPPRPGNPRPSPIFVNCRFSNNYADARGGGVSNDLGTNPSFLNCIFNGNETPQKGGGMYNDFGCSPILINCLFKGNKALSAAGIGNDGSSSPILYHVTFTENQSVDYGPALYQGTGPSNDPVLVKSVIWGNQCDWESAGLYNWHDNNPKVEYSVIQDGYPGPGNSAIDPLLDREGIAYRDVGYRGEISRFSEKNLSSLIKDLKKYRKMRAKPEQIYESKVLKSNRIVYVNGKNVSGGDGIRWHTAYGSLQRALRDAARDGAEIWVAAGFYTPSLADRSASFLLSPGVRLYGGFLGSEKERSTRNWEKNRTILSGEINDSDKINDNCYHVLIGADKAVVDGFVITGGYADGTVYDGKGGGMINYRRSPQERPNSSIVTGYSPEIRNCVFIGNYAKDGGAVYSYDRAEPKYINCDFRSNSAENGGAVIDRVGVKAVYSKCTFSNNSSRWRGGAIYFDYGSRPTLNDCIFSENTSGGHGGAVFSVSRASQLEHTSITFNGCRFENNRAKGDGGAAAFHDNSVTSVNDSLFNNNKAGRNGGAVAVTERSSVTESGNTFQNNNANGDGNDIYHEDSDPKVPEAKDLQKPEVGKDKDFSVITVGTGAPQYNPERAGPSALIRYRGALFLVDMGSDTQVRLYKANISLRDIDVLMFTHHHLDHNEEFAPILVKARLQGGGAQVIGPPGTKDYVDFILNFYHEDMAYRTGRTGRSLDKMKPVSVREVTGGETFEMNGLKVSTARVTHPIHTVAYRFEGDGSSIVISGDLSYSESLVELARGVDILVMDSGGVIKKTQPQKRRQRPRRRSSNSSREATTKRSRAHGTLEEVATMAQKAGVKKLVLTHFGTGDMDEDATLAKISEIYRGKVIFASDLMEIKP